MHKISVTTNVTEIYKNLKKKNCLPREIIVDKKIFVGIISLAQICKQHNIGIKKALNIFTVPKQASHLYNFPKKILKVFKEQAEKNCILKLKIVDIVIIDNWMLNTI